jgi:hypothetical protein
MPESSPNPPLYWSLACRTERFRSVQTDASIAIEPEFLTSTVGRDSSNADSTLHIGNQGPVQTGSDTLHTSVVPARSKLEEGFDDQFHHNSSTD